MGELTMRTVDLSPLIEERQNLGLLGGEQTVYRGSSRSLVDQLAPGSAGQPTVCSAFGEFELAAGSAQGPALVERVADQVKQAGLGGRLDPGGDSATQPQPSFPSISISLTAISFNASPKRAFSALASSSS